MLCLLFALGRLFRRRGVEVRHQGIHIDTMRLGALLHVLKAGDGAAKQNRPWARNTGTVCGYLFTTSAMVISRLTRSAIPVSP